MKDWFNSLRSISPKTLFNAQLYFMHKFHSQLLPIVSSKSPDKFLESPNQLTDVLFKLKIAEIAHVSVRGLQALFYIYIYYYHQFSSDLIIIVSMWICVTVVGSMAFAFTRQHAFFFIQIVNNMFKLQGANNSKIAKLLLAATPIICFSCTFIYLIMAIVLPLDPITIVICSFKFSSMPIPCKIIRSVVRAFDIWDFSLACFLGCLITFDGLFTSYVILHHSLNMELKHLKAKTKPSIPSLRSWIHCYRQLEIFANLVNGCFAKCIGLPSKIILVTFGIVFGAVSLKSTLRSSVALVARLCCEFLAPSIYFVMVTGYTFPGMANHKSKLVICLWKEILAAGHQTHVARYKNPNAKEIRRKIQACKDIRFLIGSSNYYEKCTSINMLNFMLQSTASLILVL